MRLADCIDAAVCWLRRTRPLRRAQFTTSEGAQAWTGRIGAPGPCLSEMTIEAPPPSSAAKGVAEELQRLEEVAFQAAIAMT